MRKTTYVAALLVATLATGNLAWAQGNGNGNGRGGDDFRRDTPHAQRDNRHDGGRDNRMDNRADNRHGDRHDNRRVDDKRGPDRHGPGYQASRGAGPDHNFRRGGRLPQEYRNRQYVVDNWRAHRLSAPPRGYHWVQTGGDYVLIAITTGIIAQILLGHY